MKRDLLILWINDNHSDNFELSETFPEDIRKEISSRWGRSGRGRLWIPSEFKLNGIEWKDNNLTRRLGESYGGIVFESKYLEQVKSVTFDSDTVITNLELEEVFNYES